MDTKNRQRMDATSIDSAQLQISNAHVQQHPRSEQVAFRADLVPEHGGFANTRCSSCGVIAGISDRRRRLAEIFSGDRERHFDTSLETATSSAAAAAATVAVAVAVAVAAAATRTVVRVASA